MQAVGAATSLASLREHAILAGAMGTVRLTGRHTKLRQPARQRLSRGAVASLEAKSARQRKVRKSGMSDKQDKGLEWLGVGRLA